MMQTLEVSFQVSSSHILDIAAGVAHKKYYL